MIERLFTSKTRVKILGYLFFYNKETYLREIVRELKLSPSAVKRELNNLLVMGLIKKKKNRIILNESCGIIDELKKIFLKTDFIVYPIRRALKKEGIKFAIIFGSFANNTYNSESDIDLLVIGNVKQKEIFRLLRPIEKMIKREINPVVWTIEELKKSKDKGFVKDIMKKNRIMIKGDEDEFQGIVRG